MSIAKGLYMEDGTFFAAKAGYGNGEGQVTMVRATNFIEIATDSLAEGMILCFSFPEAGFAPVDFKEIESLTGKAKGVVVQKIASTRNGRALRDFYQSQGIALLEGVDTRVLGFYLNSHGNANGKIKTNTDLNERIVKRPSYSLPNSGPRLAVLGEEVANNLLRLLVKLGYELDFYVDELPPDFTQIQGIITAKNLSDSWQKSLLNVQIPVIAISEAAQKLAVSLGGELLEQSLFTESYPVLEVKTGQTVTVDFRLKNLLKKVPGEPLYIELLTTRPVAFVINNILGFEFLPDIFTLKKLLRRVGL